MKSRETYNKKEKEKKKQLKKQQKQQRKEERKNNATGSSLDDMIVYVDEDGNFTDTPPDPTKKKKIKSENIELGIPKKEDVANEPYTGKVDYYDESKGYGFIKNSTDGSRYFFHVNQTLDKIGMNDKVSFDLEKGQKGMNAVNVQKA